MAERAPHPKARKTLKVGLHSVMSVLKEIDKLKHTKRLKEHLEANGAYVTIPPKTVNLIKDYVAGHGLDEGNDLMAKVVGNDPNDDPDCCTFKSP